MEIQLHRIYEHADLARVGFDQLKMRFETLYAAYRCSRKKLHQAEAAPASADALLARMTDEVLAIKEELSEIVIAVYHCCASLVSFEKVLDDLLGSVAAPQGAFDDWLAASYLLPLSLKRSYLCSPVHAAVATLGNFKTVARFREIGERHAHGMLLSGSHAWGPFYGIRGPTPGWITGAGSAPISPRSVSDIDLLVSFESLDRMGKAVEEYVATGFLCERERARFGMFRRLLGEGLVDTFSVLADRDGVPVSAHLMLNETLLGIARLKVVPIKNCIRYVRDFRTNAPKNADPGNGYPVWDLVVGAKTMFPYTARKIAYPGAAGISGYLSTKPIGGLVTEGYQKRYYMSILSFYLLIAPTVLIDRDRFLSSAIEEHLRLVQEVLGGKPPGYVTRQERMPRRVLANISGSLPEPSPPSLTVGGIFLILRARTFLCPVLQ